MGVIPLYHTKKTFRTQIRIVAKHNNMLMSGISKVPSINPQELYPEPGLPRAPRVEGREGRGNSIEGQSQRAEEEGEGQRREICRLSLDTHHSGHHGGI
jgi:hypothetical protein